MVATGCQPEPSANAPCTRTTVFTPATASGVRAMPSTASTIDKIFIFGLAENPPPIQPQGSLLVVLHHGIGQRCSCIGGLRPLRTPLQRMEDPKAAVSACPTSSHFPSLTRVALGAATVERRL